MLLKNYKVKIFIVISLIVLVVSLYWLVFKTPAHEGLTSDSKGARSEEVLGAGDLAKDKQADRFAEPLKDITRKILQLNEETDSIFNVALDLRVKKTSIENIKGSEEVDAAWQETHKQFLIIWKDLSEEINKFSQDSEAQKAYGQWIADLIAYSAALREKNTNMDKFMQKESKKQAYADDTRVQEIEKKLRQYLGLPQGSDNIP